MGCFWKAPWSLGTLVASRKGNEVAGDRMGGRPYIVYPFGLFILYPKTVLLIFLKTWSCHFPAQKPLASSWGGWAVSQMAPVIPLPHIPPNVIPFPWVWAGPNDSLLMKRMQQKWLNVTSKIRLLKGPGFHFRRLLSPLRWLTLREASCQV